MTEIINSQWLNLNVGVDDLLATWLESFYLDRKIQNVSAGTLYFYRAKIKLFLEFCEQVSVQRIGQITPSVVREYLLFLEAKGHNPGGIHAAYRVLRTFLYWWEAETEPEGWKNLIKKVKAPKLAVEPLAPVPLDAVERMLAVCKGKDLLSLRDKALLLFLLDSGARAAEVCAVNLEDVDLISGGVFVKCGKGRKPRTVFEGQKARRALRGYLKARFVGKVLSIEKGACWINRDGERLTYWGLNEMIGRRARSAGIEKPELHDFRRAFAINFLRNGGDVYSLQKLMGHADLQVLRRYLAQTNEDLRVAHERFSPVEGMGENKGEIIAEKGKNGTKLGRILIK